MCQTNENNETDNEIKQAINGLVKLLARQLAEKYVAENIEKARAKSEKKQNP